MRVSTVHLATALALSLTLCGLARASEGRDVVTVYSGASVLTYNGTIDVASSSVRRVDAHADDVTTSRAKPRAAAVPADLGDGYSVTVIAPDGLGFAGEDCTLVALDSLAGDLHAYVRCPD